MRQLSKPEVERLASEIIERLIPVVREALEDRFLTISEAAKLLGVSRDTFWRNRAFGLTVRRLGQRRMYLKSEVLAVRDSQDTLPTE